MKSYHEDDKIMVSNIYSYTLTHQNYWICLCKDEHINTNRVNDLPSLWFRYGQYVNKLLESGHVWRSAIQRVQENQGIALLKVLRKNLRTM